MVQINLRRRIQCRVSLLRRLLRRFWSRILLCSGKPSKRYQMLPRSTNSTAGTFRPPATFNDNSGKHVSVMPLRHSFDTDSDLVALKISLLGDGQTGKTSFLIKYTGNKEEQMNRETKGLNVMDKTLNISGARISYSIWEVEGDENTKDHTFLACTDSVAILFMFDLTSRCTLNGIIRWYQQARKWNQRAIPVLVGAKFDDFIKLPIDLQWAIATQARAYAKALNATLFFSSATYNINVNKIFKFITAKLFDLPWTLERNLTIGEPIIDY